MNNAISDAGLRLAVVMTGCLFLVSSAKAMSFRGSISGGVTGLVDDWRVEGVTLPEYGINDPLYVGDAITGYYSYNSPGRDVQGGSADIGLDITFKFGSSALKLGRACVRFDVVEGVPSFLLIDNSFDEYSGVSLFYFATENSFYLEEEFFSPEGIDYRRRLWGTVICSTPPALIVPESGSTSILAIIAYIGVRALRPPVKRISIRL